MATSTVEVVVAPAHYHDGPIDATNPFRYGWRYVRHDREDGTPVFEQVPLTLEDVLHPQEGDQVVHNNEHQRRVRYLCDVFEAQLAGDPTAVVLDDVLISWDHPDVRPHSPDLAVILGVREHKNWGTFDVAEEGVRPVLIVELTSPDTASLDRSNKLEEYDLAGVPLYVVVDAVATRRAPGLRLLAYAQTPEGYRVHPPDERGWIWLEPVRTWLSIQDDEIVCRDAEGQPLGNYRALAQALHAEERARQDAEFRADVAEERADVAQERADVADARIRELEEEVRRLRGNGGPTAPA